MEYANQIAFFDDYKEGDAKKLLDEIGYRGLYNECNCSTELAVTIMQQK